MALICVGILSTLIPMPTISLILKLGSAAVVSHIVWMYLALAEETSKKAIEQQSCIYTHISFKGIITIFLGAE